MPKVIDLGVREIVLKVKEHFTKEKEQYCPIQFEKVNERVAAATGLSLRTVSRIANETSMPEASVSTQEKTEKNKKRKINNIPHQEVKKKMISEEPLAVLYLDERNSDCIGSELAEAYWLKDGVAYPIMSQDGESYVTVHVSGEPSTEESPMIFRTEVTIENTTNT